MYCSIFKPFQGKSRFKHSPINQLSTVNTDKVSSTYEKVVFSSEFLCRTAVWQ